MEMMSAADVSKCISLSMTVLKSVHFNPTIGIEWNAANDRSEFKIIQ